MTSAEAVLVNNTNLSLLDTPTKRIRNRSRNRNRSDSSSSSSSRKIRRTSGMSSPSSAAAAASSAQTSKSATSKPRSRSSSSSSSPPPPPSFRPCSLGLRRVLFVGDDKMKSSPGTTPAAPLIPLGAPIELFTGMWLGRTPNSVLKAQKAQKSLDATWTARDVTIFRKKHAAMYKQYALLNIDWEAQTSQSPDSGITQKRLMTVSRKLLTVVDASDTSITLKRGKEVEKTARDLDAKPVMVKVFKRDLSGSQGSKVSVKSESRVELHEGDVLMILNSTYSYQVVKYYDRNTALTAATRDATILLDTSSSSSGSESEDRGAANNVKIDSSLLSSSSSSSSSSSLQPPLVASPATQSKSRSSRSSSVSALDRTIVLLDDSNESESNNDTDHPYQKEDGKPKARTTRTRSEVGGSQDNVICLMDTSGGSSGSSSESDHGFDTPKAARKRSAADDSTKSDLPKHDEDGTPKTRTIRTRSKVGGSQDNVICLLDTSGGSSASSSSSHGFDTPKAAGKWSAADDSTKSDLPKHEEDGTPKTRTIRTRSQSGGSQEDPIVCLLDTSGGSSASSSSSHGFDTPKASVKRSAEEEGSGRFAETRKATRTSNQQEDPHSSHAKKYPDTTSIRLSCQSDSTSSQTTNHMDTTSIGKSKPIGKRATLETNNDNDNNNVRHETGEAMPEPKISADQATTNRDFQTASIDSSVNKHKQDQIATRRSKRISNRANRATDRESESVDDMQNVPALIKEGNESQSHKKDNVPILSSRLSKPGMRIKKVFLLDENNELETEIGGASTKASAGKSVPKEKGDESSDKLCEGPPLVSPICKFWDASWGSSTTAGNSILDTEDTAQLSIVSSSSTLGTHTSTPTSKRRRKSPPPRDVPVSLANLYWKALNSSRPREGAWYLHTTMVAANTIPSNSMCQQWMELLTWGPQRTVSNPNSVTGFFWDGQRMDHAMVVWKQAVLRHPSFLLPRMISFAPGGPTEWWKTCLEYSDLAAESDDHGAGSANESMSEEQEQHRAIGMLKMRSTRLDALTVLLKSNLAFEEEQERIQRQREQDSTNAVGIVDCIGKNLSNSTGEESEDDSSDDEDTDDDDDDDEPEHLANEREATARTLVLLREIRSFGAKAVLRVVAQAMARFWLEQKEFLGYYADDDDSSSDRDDLWWSMWQERSEIVRELSSQFTELLRLMRDIVSRPGETTQPLPQAVSATGRRRTRRRRSAASSSHLTEKDVRDVVWSAMNLEVRHHLPASTKKKKRGDGEPTATDSFLLDWLLALRHSLGDDLVANLAVQVGIAGDYNSLAPP